MSPNFWRIPAALSMVAAIAGLYFSAWDVRVIISLIPIELTQTDPWGAVFSDSDVPVKVIYVALAAGGLSIVLLAFAVAASLWRGKIRSAVVWGGAAAAVTAGWTVASRSFDSRFDFHHFLGHEMFGVCAGNPIPFAGHLAVGIAIAIILAVALFWGSIGTFYLRPEAHTDDPSAP